MLHDDVAPERRFPELRGEELERTLQNSADKIEYTTYRVPMTNEEVVGLQTEKLDIDLKIEQLLEERKELSDRIKEERKKSKSLLDQYDNKTLLREDQIVCLFYDREKYQVEQRSTDDRLIGVRAMTQTEINDMVIPYRQYSGTSFSDL